MHKRSKPTKVSLTTFLSLLITSCLGVSLISFHLVHKDAESPGVTDSVRTSSSRTLEEVKARHVHVSSLTTAMPPSKMSLSAKLETRVLNASFANLQEEQNNSEFVIFYNAYISPKKPGLGIAIIQEQMLQIYNSRNHRYTPVYYNMIGVNYTENDLCQPDMNCHQLKYMLQGNEEDTLQDLFDYCVAHPSDHVIYLHDKGSLHPSANNHKIRKMATTAALSDACRSMATHHSNSSRCSVCATKYQVLPHGHSPGNHWTASCQYVRTLIPPRDFEEKRRRMYLYLLQQEKEQTLFPCLDKVLQLKASFDSKDGTYHGENHQLLGIGRYAMETWVWSSPGVVPCHVMESGFHRFDSGTESLHGDDTTFQPGPGELKFAYMGNHKLSWFHATGKLFEYRYLYPNQTLLDGTNFLIRKLNAVPQGQVAEC